MTGIIDKTATWVARNGNTFEQKVLEGQKDNPQFSFLRAGSPYHAYYAAKVREVRRDELIAEIGDKESIDSAASEKLRYKKTALGEIPASEETVLLPALPAMQKKGGMKVPEAIPAPPAFVWVLEKPNISALQDDLIKISAQYVARNGLAFQSGLMEREKNNRQFDFLRQLHPLNTYFKRLVADYTRVLLPERGLTEQLQQTSKEKKVIVDKVMKRVQWERSQKKTSDQKKQEEEAERNAMAAIDWHDFVVVQTIEWDDEDDTQSELLIDQRELEGLIDEDKPDVGPKEKDELDFMGDIQDVEMEMDDDEKYEPEPQKDIKIRQNYDPRQRPADLQTTKVLVGDQAVDLNDVSHTMTVMLSNTVVREKNKAMAAAQKPSNLTGDAEMAENLQEFASRRTDIFGDEEVMIGAKIGERRKKHDEKATWDGHSGSAQAVTMAASTSVQQQIKAIHEASSSKMVGPKLDDVLVSQTIVVPAGIGLKPQAPKQPAAPQQVQAPPMMYGRPMMPGMPPFPGGGIPGMPGMAPGGGVSGGPMPPHFMRPGMPPFPGGMPGMPPFPGGGMPGTGFPMARPVLAPEPIEPGGGVPGVRPPASNEPPLKKVKTGDEDEDEERQLNLVPEREWLDKYSGPVNIVVTVPNMQGKSPFPMHGQTLRIQAVMSDPIRAVKEKISASLGGMPANKQKLKTDELGFLKDALSLAYYNAKDGITLELGIKERGGRKK